MTVEKVYRENETELNVPSVVHAWLQNWWMILICGLMVGMWAHMAAHMAKPQVYVSEAIFIVNNDKNDIQAYDFIDKITSQYKEIFTSDVLANTIRNDLKTGHLPGKINVFAVPETNMICLQGQSDNPGDAFRIVQSAVEHYDEVSDHVLSDYSLNMLKRPAVAQEPQNKYIAFIWNGIGVLAGILVAAFAIAAAVTVRDDIKSERQVEKLLDSRLFATLYFEKKKRREKKKSILITNPTTSFLYAENVKKMATRLDYEARKNEHKTFIVTSVDENEGKSTVASNLALALANKNKKVLLLDCDFRKPALYKVFEKKIMPRREIGGFFLGKNKLEDVLLVDRHIGLCYSFGMRRYANVDKLLSSEKLQQIIQFGKQYADYVIIDTPPTGIATDAEVMAQYVDGVIMVVKQGGSRAGDINDSLDNLKKNGAEVYGCVLNAVKTKIIPGSQANRYGGKYGKYGEYGNYADKQK